MQTLIVIGIYFIFSLQICVELKIRVSVVINLELTFKKAAGGWLTVEVKYAWILNSKSLLIWKQYYTISQQTIPMKQSVSVIYLLRVALWLFVGWMMAQKE